jgi:glycerol-3-phosphate dehydrogenase
MRPRALIRLGLFLYDHLAARRRIPSSGSVDLARDPAGQPLRSEFATGFSYYDCWVDDARLVLLAALDAAERGAAIHTRTAVTRMTPSGDVWEISAGSLTFAARAVVNAAGPWCAEVADLAGPGGHAPTLRLVKGTHIVVPRIAGAEDAYLLQNPDGRVVFALPFEHHFTLIGTTEVGVTAAAEGFLPSADEETYLLTVARQFFSRPLSKDDIVWRFAGVRPLVEDGASRAAAVSREYRLDLVQPAGAPPLLNVVGGKITTFRRLAETVMTRLAPFFPAMGPAWTAHAPLPGGDAGGDGIPAYRQEFVRRHPRIASETLRRLVALYGTRAELIVGDATSDADLGEAIGGGLTAREVTYLRDHEWARSADDVLWRRTKAGLHLNAAERATADTEIARLLA